ncbi:hypothetical protein GCM10007158_05070 [Vreelandella hamiltonii]|uniref:Uncharacterized protein n=1 Tax=Halomonas johnsoniae TaxID=502832 RepID=A0ABQ2WAX9_9GAMM|nr:hypothetical protein GCM10007158_05070 [Halomonas johnsoniae]
MALCATGVETGDGDIDGSARDGAAFGGSLRLAVSPFAAAAWATAGLEDFEVNDFAFAVTD